MPNRYVPQVKEKLDIWEMAPLCRFEPDGAELLDINPDISQLFDKIGWGNFLRAFSGHNVEVTRQFALTFKEIVAHIGDIRLEIYEYFIAKATNQPQRSERWFKMKEVNKEKLKSFLLPLPEGFDDKNGYLVKYVQPQWEMIFHMIIHYITCDGRYSSVPFYHLRILMAFKGSKLILPYFLFKSLQKMAIAVQSTIAEQDRYIFHRGLVKVLVQYQLSFINVTS